MIHRQGVLLHTGIINRLSVAVNRIIFKNASDIINHRADSRIHTSVNNTFDRCFCQSAYNSAGSYFTHCRPLVFGSDINTNTLKIHSSEQNKGINLILFIYHVSRCV